MFVCVYLPPGRSYFCIADDGGDDDDDVAADEGGFRWALPLLVFAIEPLLAPPTLAAVGVDEVLSGTVTAVQ